MIISERTAAGPSAIADDNRKYAKKFREENNNNNIKYNFGKNNTYYLFI